MNYNMPYRVWLLQPPLSGVLFYVSFMFYNQKAEFAIIRI